MRLKMTGAAVLLLAALITAAPAAAQTTPLTAREVVGSWVLRFMPNERRRVTVRPNGGERPEMRLTVAPRGAALACAIGDEPAACAIRNGAFVVTWNPSGSAMIFTMSGRASDGFSGNARVRAPLLPVSGDVGPVAMVRAPER